MTSIFTLSTCWSEPITQYTCSKTSGFDDSVLKGRAQKIDKFDLVLKSNHPNNLLVQLSHIAAWCLHSPVNIWSDSRSKQVGIECISRRGAGTLLFTCKPSGTILCQPCQSWGAPWIKNCLKVPPHFHPEIITSSSPNGHRRWWSWWASEGRKPRGGTIRRKGWGSAARPP